MEPTVKTRMRPRPTNMGGILRASAMLLAVAAIAGLPRPATSAPKAPQRSLIIFAPHALSADLSKQKAVVAKERDGFRSRDIGVVYVIGQNVSAEVGPQPTAIPVKLRSHYRVARNDFRVVLIGKDGQTEMISDAPVTAEQLFQTIDAQPARKGGAKPPG
jgi:hypothetical protein